MKRRNYTFALTKDNDRIIKIVEKYPKYAYIKHDQDDAEEHYHYYVEFPNPRSLTSVANELGVPPNMLEAVYSKKGILEYLTHENQPDKHHYDKSEIVTNFNIDEKDGLTTEDLIQECHDWWAVLDGTMSIDDFIMSHNTHFATLSIRSRIEVWTKARGTGGLSPFRVPCSITPIRGTKDGAS